jgi:L-asparaginase
MTLADMARVRDAVLAALDEADVTGIIVAHGTDAMEETAFLIDLSPPVSKPVIVTGAMLPMTDPDSDGPGNLAAALRAAATPNWRSMVLWSPLPGI